MVQTFVNIHRVVHHIRLRQKLYLGFQDLVVSVQLLVLQKLKKREHEMSVEVWSHLCCQIILRHRSTKQKKKKKPSPTNKKNLFTIDQIFSSLLQVFESKDVQERNTWTRGKIHKREKREKRQRLRKARILPIQAQTLTLILAKTQ